MHNCAFKIKEHFHKVDNLISSIKKLTIKSKDRTKKFVNIPCPPQPIVTRWNSWLQAVNYYFKYLPEIKKIVLSLKDDGKIVKKAKKAISMPGIIEELIYIEQNYGFFRGIIEKIENSNISLETAYLIQNEINLKNDRAGIASYLNKRWQKHEINNIKNFYNQDLTPEHYSLLLNCPATSISIERSFSSLGNLITNNRHFKNENVEKYMLLYTFHD